MISFPPLLCKGGAYLKKDEGWTPSLKGRMGRGLTRVKERNKEKPSKEFSLLPEKNQNELRILKFLHDARLYLILAGYMRRRRLAHHLHGRGNQGS